MPMNETASPVESVSTTLPPLESTASAQGSPSLIASQISIEERHPSVVPGLIGALIGSIPGVLLWVIIGQLGYIAGICGWLMVRGAIFGYTKLGGGINKLGKFLASAVAFIMPLVAEYLGVAVSVYRAFHESDGVTVAQAFASVPYFLSEPDVSSGIITNLLIGYVLFAVSFIHFKPKESKFEQSKIPRL